MYNGCYSTSNSNSNSNSNYFLLISVLKIKGFIPNNDGNVDVRSHLNRKERSEETHFKKEDLLKAGVIESLYILLSKFWDHELACMAGMCTV